jgi:uncharacterized protein YwqG
LQPELEALLRQYAKPAYVARLTAGEPQGPVLSKFGGQPYFEAGEQWPACGKCQQGQFFICQVDVSQCPSAGLDRYFGLVGFFYCWQCFPWDPAQPGWTVINHAEPSAEKFVAVKSPAAPLPGFLSRLFRQTPSATTPCGMSFQNFFSFPQMDEFELLAGDRAAKLLTGEDIADQYYDQVEKLSGRSDDYSTMVGGYAEWIQGLPELKCNLCGSHLEQLMQIGSEQQAGIMFGDAGAAYLLFCRDHPGEVKLFTQCF